MNEAYWEKEEPIEKLHCSFTDCENDLHSFRRTRPKKGETYRTDVCNNCGADVIDWERLENLDLTDADFTFSSLKNEWIRNYFWYRQVEESVFIKAEKKGLDEIRIWTTKRLNNALAPHWKDIWRDGSQTSFHGNIVFYAQHATGTCCRKCVQEWYNIERTRKLTSNEVDYFLELIMMYTQHKLPELS